MKKVLAVIFVLAMVLTVIPLHGDAFAASNVDPEIISMKNDGNKVIEVLVKFSAEPVVQTYTYHGAFPTTSSEIMRPGNVMTSVAMTPIRFQQSVLMPKLANIKGIIKVGTPLQYVYNGVYMRLPVNKVFDVARIHGVKYVTYLPEMKVDRIRSKTFLGAERVWNEVKDPKGRKVDGTGIICAVTDTGIDYTHQDFGSQKSPQGKKVIISHDFGDNDADCQEIQPGGSQQPGTSHGTACSGIIAGDGPDNEKGMAPKALLAGYKISDSSRGGGLNGEGILKAFEYLVTEKIHVSNNSYGAPGGSSWMDEIENSTVLAGCAVVASQGNEGSPGPKLPIPSGSTATPDNVIGVGATDDTDGFAMKIEDAPTQEMQGTLFSGQWGDTGKVFGNTGAPLELVDCGWGRPEDFEGLDLTGKAALIQRGPSPVLFGDKFGPAINFKDKNLNASKAGAKVMVLYNHEPGKIGALYANSPGGPLDKNLIPSFHLSRIQGEALRKELHRDNEWELGQKDTDQKKIIISFGKPSIKANVADFTSSGPTRRMMLKPDVSAPGVGIETTNPTWDAKNPYMFTFGGTSAAGPFVAGCVSLIRQARPDWNPFEIKRAVMNTAIPLKRFDGQGYIPLTVQGQGRINVYNAINTDLMFQPPSGLIDTNNNNAIHVADWPAEWADPDKRSQLPANVRDYPIGMKIYNYNDKENKNIEFSFEVNARYPERIDVSFSTKNLTVPKMVGKKPGEAWVGFNITLPKNIQGNVNDIFIWATDKATGKKWHVGWCIYNNQNPRNNTHAGAIEINPPEFTPNGDGEQDEIKVDYTLTNGTLQLWSGYAWDSYLNFQDELIFWAIDLNSERWVKIHEASNVEIGNHSFIWDGKDSFGNYILPEGEWFIQVSASGSKLDLSKRAFVPISDDFNLLNESFVVSKSTVPPLPTIFAYALPIEPGVGDEFSVGIYIKYAVNVKTLQFQINLKGSEGIIKYLGHEVGEFMQRDEPNLLTNIEYDEEKNIVNVDMQRALDGVSGEGYLLKLRFLAEEANYFDVNFQNLLVTRLEDPSDPTSEKSAKAFYRKGEISIYKTAYSVADFNRDGVVNEKDAAIILGKLGLRRGDDGFFWRCDLNFDDVIDINDLTEFAKLYQN